MDRFAAALKLKLRGARDKYGYETEPWRLDDWESLCRLRFKEHVTKGDPLDIAAYAAFAWHHGWSLEHPRTNAIAAARREALEEAVEVCREIGMAHYRLQHGLQYEELDREMKAQVTAEECMTAIRALIDKELQA